MRRENATISGVIVREGEGFAKVEQIDRVAVLVASAS
jgi:hypothetical protein